MRTFLLVLSLAGGVLPLARPLHAATATVGRPEIRGLYIGMPEADARKQLQSLSDAAKLQDVPAARVESEAPGGFAILRLSLSDGGHLRVYLTAPPQPSVVWYVSFAQYIQTNLIERGTFMESLHGKYGKETALVERVPGNPFLCWLYDEKGQRVSSMDTRMLETCSGEAEALGQRLVIEGPTERNTKEPFNSCVASYTGLSFQLGRDAEKGPEFVRSYDARLVSLPLAARSGAATAAAKNAAADAANKQDLEKAKKSKPTL